MSRVFAEYARYYDRLYRDKDYAGESDYVAGLLARWSGSIDRILEFGSGTGRHALCLAARGFAVTGVERSPGMLVQSLARAETHRRELEASGRTPPVFIDGDMRAVRLGRRFDAVLSLFHAVGYQIEDEDLRATFQTAREHLREGGLFLFDAWYGPAVLKAPPAPRVMQACDGDLNLVRYSTPTLMRDRNVVDVDYRLMVERKATGARSETTETHRMRYLFEPEVLALARSCGMEAVAAEEWLTGRPLGRDTWRACFIVQRKIDEAARCRK